MDMAKMLNRSQQVLDQLPPSMPQCVRPALMWAMTNWFIQGAIPSVLLVDTGGQFPEHITVPPALNGVALPRWMYVQGEDRNASAVYFAFESVEDTLVVLYQTPDVFHRLSAEVVTTGQQRDIGAWSIQTLYPEA
jgi:hypothetical protein